MIAHLHCHSHYSILDGLGKPEDIVKRAKEIGAKAVAITDHASITAMPELFKCAKEAEIKPIIGCEFYVTDQIEGVKGERRYHLTVLAKNWTGVQSLMAQLTLANRQFYHRPRLAFEQIYNFENCIIMSACSGGILAHDNWEAIVEKLQSKYRHDFYLEVMPHVIQNGTGDHQELVNSRALTASQKFRIGLVATNDAHYVTQPDFHTHEILLAIQTAKKWDDPKRWTWETDAFYMRDLTEMVGAFKINCPYMDLKLVGEALKNTMEIADKCDIQMPTFDVHLPSIYSDDDAQFAALVSEGWRSKLVPVFSTSVDPNITKTYHDRLVYEAAVIRKLGFVRYFLMVEDIIRTARAKGIMVGPARGSAAGSLVCYLMNITQVDPIRHKLFFERFLNPERIDLPDIDVDFQDDRRAEVFDYISQKYGASYTANISTVTVLGLPSAFRDVARVFGVDNIKINMLSKLIADDESFDTNPELNKFMKANNDNANIVKQAKKLVGTIRASGVHPCGFIVSSERLENVAAIERRKNAQVVNWDMRLCETFGLLKVDVLGLSTLTILDKARRMIKKHRGVDIDFTKIPLDDEPTLTAFSEGRGAGIFQFENSGMQALLKALKANTFETITDTTALYRPGSLESGETERYTQIAQGHRYEEYICPELEPILKPTRGIMVYQEQIMRIFNELGGFTWAESDKMRKIIGKKLGADAFNEHKGHFISGCITKGISEPAAEIIFTKMVEFAKYSFNLSHAVAYTMISFWCMFTKVHYPAEFFASHLTYRSDSNVGEVIKDARAMGVEVLRPDINLSTAEYEIANETLTAIIAPIGIVKGIGPKCVEAVLEARKDGVFMSEGNFRSRVEGRTCNKNHLDFLKRAGAFESLGVREPSQQEREKNYAELLPIFDTLPTLEKRGVAYDKEAVANLFRDVAFCSRLNGKELMMPSAGPRPYIMVVNNPVKSEKEHLTNKGTKYFLAVAEKHGIPGGAFYYTGAAKCNFFGKDPSKECAGKCADFLRVEVKLVKPKLVICFASNMAGVFTSERNPTARKLAGRVEFNKEFNCYVLFSYSPQYAYYNEDKVGAQFDEAMGKISEIFK